jgi:hypothetical protein
MILGLAFFIECEKDINPVWRYRPNISVLKSNHVRP